MALPTSPWHAWYEGEPDNQDGVEHCAVVTNYKYWAIRKLMLGSYAWRDFSCLFNNNNIQGYICERKGLLRVIVNTGFNCYLSWYSKITGACVNEWCISLHDNDTWD